ncbi:MAG: transcriptional repressor [Syntrophaceae bacterium]|nr:transcriptional repressor [Syntrophaceae bacterium]
METASLLEILKGSGCRITRTRRAVLDILSTSRVLLSADDLRQALAARGLRVNKTTVYRELSFLKGRGIVHEIHFGDGTIRYRLCPDTHHHHVICLNCKRAEEVALEGDLRELEADIGQTKGFQVLHHTLEFFGLCPDCHRATGSREPSGLPAAQPSDRVAAGTVRKGKGIS